MVPTLLELTLRGNPVSDNTPGFRAHTLCTLPSIEVLDDEPARYATPEVNLASCDSVDSSLRNGAHISDLALGKSPTSSAPQSPHQPAVCADWHQELLLVSRGIKYAEVCSRHCVHTSTAAASIASLTSPLDLSLAPPPRLRMVAHTCVSAQHITSSEGIRVSPAPAFGMLFRCWRLQIVSTHAREPMSAPNPHP